MSNTRDGSHRPKLLFLCQTLPYPPDGGVHLRSYNIMRLLSRAFDITALCFFREASRSPDQVEASVAGLSRIADVEAFPIPQDRSRVRFLWDHLRSVASRRVYTRFVYESEGFEWALTRALEDGDFDIVHMDSLDLSAYLPLLSHLPVVCTHHNVESALLRRRAATEPLVVGAYLKLQALFMEREEGRAGGSVDLNVVVSERDEERLSRIVSEMTEITVVPNGVDTDFFQPRNPGVEGVVFVGGYSWFPNRDALGYFAKSILPHLRKARPSLPVTWVGDCPESVRAEFEQRYGITLTGFVDDIRPYVDRAGCYVVPLRVGGGTRLKILDAWAMGKAVVSTSVGCEGLDTTDGKNILVREHPAEFAEGVLTILDDADLRRRLEVNGRATAKTIYEWDVIGEGMLDEYMKLVSGR